MTYLINLPTPSQSRNRNLSAVTIGHNEISQILIGKFLCDFCHLKVTYQKIIANHICDYSA